ncbi:hypothetical protein QMK33_13630 [Hymenobacter sp. H14-R3]|uniref:hypothetical protein n=1 Tax=Hymenobacter sp. H14-R3 TaxID=3046308 RepID=UPI0024BB876E|nr:hypothetical protein [Hymenobacter sp. H14-R3]MDJ0366194.1 hypothetical protein [Hymenobacter sp. H14-R3]
MQTKIAFLSYAILLVAALVGGLRFKKLPTNLRYLVALVGLEVATEALSYTLSLFHQPNLFIMPIFAAGEIWLLALVYDKTMNWLSFSRVRPWLAGSFAAYCIVDSLLSPEMARFKPALLVVESLLVLGLVGLYFRKLLSELRVTNLSREPMFWVSIGLVINHLGNLQIYLFSNLLLTNYSRQLNLNIWAIHALLLVILYSCYCVALWIRPQK